MRKRFLRIPPDGIAKHDKCSQENLRCETRLPRKEGGHRKQRIHRKDRGIGEDRGNRGIGKDRGIEE